MEEKTEPVRLCEHGNELIGKNPIMELLSTDLADVLGSLSSKSDQVLDKAYVHRRYVAREKKGRLASLQPKRYSTQHRSHWSAKHGRWVLVASRPEALRQLGTLTKDRAQILVMDFLMSRLRIVATPIAVQTSARQADVASRLLFVQAGAGTGKSTMLEHLARIIVPTANTKEILEANIVPLTVDLNNHSSDDSLDDLWKEIVGEFRSQLKVARDFDTTDGWRTISEHLFVDAQGTTSPAIFYSTDQEKAKNKIIRKCEDSRVFLKRVARYLGSESRRSTPVFILDNIDRHPVRMRQARLIERFFSLLRKIPEAIGIVSVRRSTLGALGHLERFSGHLQSQQLFLTPPLIGEVIQRRLDLIVEEIDQDSLSIQLELGKNTSIGIGDIRDLLSHICTAFSSSTSNLDSRMGWSKARATSIERLLPYAFHSNSRGALAFAAAALESWALRLNPVVTTFLYQRDNRKPVQLPAFTTDSLIRLGAVSRHRYYDHTNSSGLFNVYCFRRTAPNPSAGRFPLLILYRSIQHFARVGKSTKREFFETTSAFGYSKKEREEILALLIDGMFVESPEGTKLSTVRNLTRTKKLEYYYEVLCINMTYLENMRNDSIIEYDAAPHDVDDSLIVDLGEMAAFIGYALDQERLEYRYMKRKDGVHLSNYRKLVFDSPISVRMFRSVVGRVQQLLRNSPRLLDQQSRSQYCDVFGNLRSSIVSASKSKEIWPPLKTGLPTVRV